MNRSDDDPIPRRGAPGDADRLLWRRAGALDAPADEAAWLLDLAALAEGRLDDDERARVAARLADDPEAAADVAAARALADAEPGAAGDRIEEAVVARALALVPDGSNVVALARPPRRHVMPVVARWTSLAAAMLLASWLGFAMGSDASLHYTQLNQPSLDTAFPDLLDPATGFLLHDLGEGAPI